MPIKFRCRHCRQFLGISNSRAGQVVDCPACGRAIRIPDLDGSVRPLSKPALNLRDTELAQALDEVAHIGSVQSLELRYGEAAASEMEAASPPQAPAVMEPLPLPAAVPIDPPLPPELVVAAERPRPAPTRESVVGRNNNHKASGVAAIDELAALSALPSAKTARRTARGRSDTNFRLLLEPLVVSALIVVAMVFLGCGFWIARLSSSGQATGIAANGVHHVASDDDKLEKPAVDASVGASVRGRITEKSSTGESRVSAGSKVIAVAGNPPAAKLPSAGLQATSSPQDFMAAREAIRKAGGDAAIVDETGAFGLKLQTAGTYSLLVLSRFQTRDTKRPIEPALKQLLESHFERPESLPGKALYHLGRIRYRGSGTDVWDHAFEAE